jgi:hypothetical protein
MRTIREEAAEPPEYSDFAEEYGQLGRFVEEVYDPERSRSSLGT